MTQTTSNHLYTYIPIFGATSENEEDVNINRLSFKRVAIANLEDNELAFYNETKDTYLDRSDEGIAKYVQAVAKYLR